MVAQISSLLATSLYENNDISKVSYSIHVKQSLRPTFAYSWGGGVKVMSLPLVSRSVDPVCFSISPLYQIISSHQFHQPSYYIYYFKQVLCKHHVRDPESTSLRKKHLLTISNMLSKIYLHLFLNLKHATYRLLISGYYYVTLLSGTIMSHLFPHHPYFMI